MSILVADFHKSYGTTVAVGGLSFQIQPGEILGLVGPNGAGKTTTMRALAGILPPTRGRLFIAGHDLAREPIQAKACLAYVPDEPRLFDQLTVLEHLQFTAGIYGVADWQTKAKQLLSQFELTEKRDALASELSRGMRQKVAICCGYLHQPKAVLLDEPLTGLDPHGIRTMKESIRQRAAEGVSFMVSSHLLSLIEDLCTTLLILKQGQQVLNGRLTDLRQRLTLEGRQESLEDLFFRLVGQPPSVPPVETATTTGV